VSSVKLTPKNQDELIKKIHPNKLVIYGKGYIGKLIADWCVTTGIKYFFCDEKADILNNENECEVISPSQLMKKYPNAYVVIASINYYDEINNNLMQMKFNPDSILSYLEFWSPQISWKTLEKTADWNAVKERARIFSQWVNQTSKLVFDYSYEKNYLKEFLPAQCEYFSPNYIQFEEYSLHADFTNVHYPFNADVSSCIAILMSFTNPEVLIDHLCKSSLKHIIISYVTIDRLPDINFRRSINYVNDFSENQLIYMFSNRGFILKKVEIDPFDQVHTVYLFERKFNILENNTW